MTNLYQFRLVATGIIMLTANLGLMAQTPDHLEIRGQSELKAVPDQVTCVMRSQAIRPDYDDALKALDRQLKDIAKVITKLGFLEEALKSKNFSIGPNRVYQRGSAKDSGFVARQDLEITFPLNREKVLDLINEMSDSKADPSLSFRFSFSPQLEKTLENQLIKQAVADAKEKATVIAVASEIRLGSIMRISYDPSPGPQPRMMAMAERSMAADDRMDFAGFQVPEMELTRSIVVQWRIE